MSTINALAGYREALIEWKKRGGLEGRGGAWNASTRKYDFASEPTPEQCGLANAEKYIVQYAKQIRESVLGK